MILPDFIQNLWIMFLIKIFFPSIEVLLFNLVYADCVIFARAILFPLFIYLILEIFLI